MKVAKHVVRDVLTDVGWGAWVSMTALEPYETTTLIVKIWASFFFLASSLVTFPEVNWVAVLMQLFMLGINLSKVPF